MLMFKVTSFILLLCMVINAKPLGENDEKIRIKTKRAASLTDSKLNEVFNANNPDLTLAENFLGGYRQRQMSISFQLPQDEDYEYYSYEDDGDYELNPLDNNVEAIVLQINEDNIEELDNNLAQKFHYKHDESFENSDGTYNKEFKIETTTPNVLEWNNSSKNTVNNETNNHINQNITDSDNKNEIRSKNNTNGENTTQANITDQNFETIYFTVEANSINETEERKTVNETTSEEAMFLSRINDNNTEDLSQNNPDKSIEAQKLYTSSILDINTTQEALNFPNISSIPLENNGAENHISQPHIDEAISNVSKVHTHLDDHINQNITDSDNKNEIQSKNNTNGENTTQANITDQNFETIYFTVEANSINETEERKTVNETTSEEATFPSKINDNNTEDLSQNNPDKSIEAQKLYTSSILDNNTTQEALNFPSISSIPLENNGAEKHVSQPHIDEGNSNVSKVHTHLDDDVAGRNETGEETTEINVKTSTGNPYQKNDGGLKDKTLSNDNDIYNQMLRNYLSSFYKTNQAPKRRLLNQNYNTDSGIFRALADLNATVSSSSTSTVGVADWTADIMQKMSTLVAKYIIGNNTRYTNKENDNKNVVNSNIHRRVPVQPGLFDGNRFWKL